MADSEKCVWILTALIHADAVERRGGGPVPAPANGKVLFPPEYSPEPANPSPQ